jgi:hypothetical protein
MLHQEEMEYIGTLYNIRIDVGNLAIDRHIHEQNSNDISLQERLPVVFAGLLLAKHLLHNQDEVVRLKPYRPIDKDISREEADR